VRNGKLRGRRRREYARNKRGKKFRLPAMDDGKGGREN
jgi:hypothetical protein